MLLLENFLLIVFLVLQVSQVSSFWPFSESAAGVNLTQQRHRRQPQQVDCMNLNDQITVQEIINTACITLQAGGDSVYEFKIKGEHNDWNTYINGLQAIVNINFVFDGTSVKTIEITNPIPVTNSNLIIKNNNDLTRINIQASQLLWGLTVNNNPTLKAIELHASSLMMMTPIFSIENNAQLETIDMGKLKKIDINGAVTIQQNEKLKTINMGTLTSFKANNMVLEKNPVLEKLEMPQLTDFTVIEKVAIKKNGQLTEINFNQNLAGTFSAPLLEIEQNDKLTNIAIKAEKVTTETATVRGNRLLSKDSLDNLSKITASKTTTIQELGECIFDSGPVKDLSELDGCVVISGGLKFIGSPTGSISNRDQLKTINGDVDLDGLSSDAADFLSEVTITGAIKSSICDFKLPRHKVSSPACPITEAPSTRVAPKSPMMTPTAGTVAPSGQDVSSCETSIWSRGDVKGVVAGAFAGGILIGIAIVLACFCCISVDKFKKYKRIFPCCNKKDNTQPSDEKYDDNKHHKKKDKKKKREKRASSHSYTTDETVTKSTTPKAEKRTPGRSNSRQTITRSTENTTSAESVDQKGSADLHEEPTQKTDGKEGASIKTGRQGRKKSTDTRKQRRKKSSKTGNQGLQEESTQPDGKTTRDGKQKKSKGPKSNDGNRPVADNKVKKRKSNYNMRSFKEFELKDLDDLDEENYADDERSQ